MKKILIIPVVLTAVLLAVGVYIFVSEPSLFSENENRMLEQKPVLTADTFGSGEFQSSLEDFLSDQFPGRDGLMALGTDIKKLAGRSDIGGAYIGKNGYYFEKVTDSDINEKRYESNLKTVDSLAGKYPETQFSVMLVPSSGTVLSEYLPDGAKMYSAGQMEKTAEKTLSYSRFLGVYDMLNTASENYIYYRTDHHWTSYGAYLGYLEFMGERASYEYAECSPVTDSFLGTLYSKTLDSSAVPDEIFLPADDTGITVTADGSGGCLYDKDALDEKDKYRVFMGGNHGIAEITGKGDGTLLVIKDSFANCMIPYLAYDYGKIIMVDLRYYPGSVSALIRDTEPDECLVLYEMSNFACDQNISKLML